MKVTDRRVTESERQKEVTSVAAFSEKRGDNLSSGIIRFNEQNPQPLPPDNLSSPILLMMMIILTLHVHELLLPALKTLIPQRSAHQYMRERERERERREANI